MASHVPGVAAVDVGAQLTHTETHIKHRDRERERNEGVVVEDREARCCGQRIQCAVLELTGCEADTTPHRTAPPCQAIGSLPLPCPMRYRVTPASPYAQPPPQSRGDISRC